VGEDRRLGPLGQPSPTPIAILVGWAVVSTAAGAVLTRRRPVQ
jgi:hypothetical protein